VLDLLCWRIVAQISIWICLRKTVMSRCGCMPHVLWRSARSFEVYFHVASLLVHCIIDFLRRFQLLLQSSARLWQ